MEYAILAVLGVLILPYIVAPLVLLVESLLYGDDGV